MRVSARTAKPRFVAGALGPTNRTAFDLAHVSNPGYRAVTFDDLRKAMASRSNGLLDGGADMLLVETIFDTAERQGGALCDFGNSRRTRHRRARG